MDRMHRGQNFRIQTASTYEVTCEISVRTYAVDNQRSGYPMLNIYLQHLIYMRTVLGDEISGLPVACQGLLLPLCQSAHFATIRRQAKRGLMLVAPRD